MMVTEKDDGFFLRTAKIYVNWMDSENFINHSIALFWTPVLIPILIFGKFRHLYDFARFLDGKEYSTIPRGRGV